MKKIKTFAIAKTITAEKAPASLDYAIGRPTGAGVFIAKNIPVRA